MIVTIAQLPFPSTSDLHPSLVAYYRDYSARFTGLINSYFVPEGRLWEMPLWVAHLAGMLKAIEQEVQFVDLSTIPPLVHDCLHHLLCATRPGDLVMLSPLAQNFELAKDVSRRLLADGRRTVIGGNMASLAEADCATAIYRGILDADALIRTLHEIESGTGILEIATARRGRVSWQPAYELLRQYRSQVPLLRLNASHGCLFDCAFCGDAWSRKLHVVEPAALEAEVRQLEEIFPETRLIYLGDKTFGQSPEAVANLLQTFKRHPQYRFIVQSHIALMDERLIDTMAELGVIALEIGFESGDATMLRQSRKISAPPERYEAVFDRLHAAGVRVILNVMGSLPLETTHSHKSTVAAIRRWSDRVWLYNLYNFVPYPLTPYFPELRERIFNWEFADWREDAPAVFTPYRQSADAAWHAFLDKVAVAHEALNQACWRNSEAAL